MIGRQVATAFLLAAALGTTTAWMAAPQHKLSITTTTSISSRIRGTTTTQLYADNNPFSFLFNPYESKIPDSLKDEIYAAEARTPAAQQRGSRVALYGLLAFLGICLAFFSAFITELRNTALPPGETGDPLAVAGFTWVYSNFLLEFLLTNKLGGGLCLFFGAGSGLMAEAELDTKRINAEKIFEEMERRREKNGGSKNSSSSSSKQRKGKKRRPGKEKKRLQALSELVTEEPTTATATVEENAVTPSEEPAAPEKDKKDDSLMGKMKGFYDQADSMAASQALLLNKKLEDEGLMDKITDETGLKVVGKEAAAKLQQEKEKGGDDDDDNNNNNNNNNKK